jgi:uncharacterized protein (UPF0332 family)
MSEGMTTMVSMNELENQIRIARKCLQSSIEDEERDGYEIDSTMERKWNEGFLEALEFVYILQNGHEYNGE